MPPSAAPATPHVPSPRAVKAVACFRIQLNDADLVWHLLQRPAAHQGSSHFGQVFVGQSQSFVSELPCAGGIHVERHFALAGAGPKAIGPSPSQLGARLRMSHLLHLMPLLAASAARLPSPLAVKAVARWIQVNDAHLAWHLLQGLVVHQGIGSSMWAGFVRKPSFWGETAVQEVC